MIILPFPEVSPALTSDSCGLVGVIAYKWLYNLYYFSPVLTSSNVAY